MENSSLVFGIYTDTKRQIRVGARYHILIKYNEDIDFFSILINLILLYWHF